MSKILSAEKFFPSKMLSNISIQKSGKNRTKLSKFQLGVENFVRRNILSVENFVQYFYTKVRQKADKTVEISAWCRKFCPTKYFVRRKFCPTKFCPIRYVCHLCSKLCTQTNEIRKDRSAYISISQI